MTPGPRDRWPVRQRGFQHQSVPGIVRRASRSRRRMSDLRRWNRDFGPSAGCTRCARRSRRDWA